MADENERPVLEFDRVCVGAEGQFALEDVSFVVHKGETLVIFGAASSGKTVLIKTALGLVRPDSGRVVVFGNEITRMRERDLFAIRSKMGVLFQEGGLFDSLTIEENVGYPLVNLKGFELSPEEVHNRAEEALRFVELEQTLDKFPSELSGGMRRRVGIARAIVTEPPLVLYDSPTAGLDPITSYTIITLIMKERDLKDTATLMVTHRFQDGHLLATAKFDAASGQPVTVAPEEADKLRTTFLVLRDGRLVFEGTLPELEASTDAYVQKFVRRED